MEIDTTSIAKTACIPANWQVVKIGSLAKVMRGASPRPIDDPVWFDDRSRTGWLRISDVTAAGKYLDRTVQNLSTLGITNSRFVKEGSLVMSICATVGRPVITRKDVCIHDGFVVFDNLRAHNEYVYYVLTDIEDDWSKKDQTGSQMNLNIDLINSTTISLPPATEQRAIADALSDVDELLDALDALITKKWAVKQAAMQQLLTGKIRLPGFNRTWKTRKIREMLTYERPDHYIVQYQEYTARGDFPVLTANKSFILGYTNETFGICTDLPVILFDDFTTDCKYVTFPFKVKSSAIKLLRARKRVDLSWVFERIQMVDFPLSDHKRYYISYYQNTDLAFPSYDEQLSIASVISDMDAEIAALQRRRDKTRAFKQGMMQQLLTGRTQLPVLE